jgi:hypothetical protein
MSNEQCDKGGLYVLDVESAEPQVLAGIDWSRVDIEIMVIEVNKHTIRKEGATMKDSTKNIIRILEEQNYCQYWSCSLTIRRRCQLMTVLLSSLGSLCRVLLRRIDRTISSWVFGVDRTSCLYVRVVSTRKRSSDGFMKRGAPLAQRALPIPSQPFSRLCTFEPSAAYTLAYTVSALYCMTNSIHSCLRKRKLQMHVRLGSLSEFA